jgi:hypothetical protein
MSTVADIINAVKRLQPHEKNELLERLSEVDFEDAWDRQIAADASAGKLDKLIDQAISEHREGRTIPFP